MSPRVSLFKRLINKLSNEAWKLETAAYVTVLRAFKKAPPAQTGAAHAQEGKRVYLTFDDGPSPYTARLLDILSRYNAKATFFVKGGGDMNLVARAARQGHAIGNHTVSHGYRDIYANEEAFLNELKEMERIIHEKTGSDSRLMRFPGGSSNTVSIRHCPGIMTRLTSTVEQLGYTYFDWDVDSGDANIHQTSRRIYKNIISGIKENRDPIILQHDDKIHSIAAVERVLIWGLRKGYTFLPLDADSPTAHHTLNN